jgi:hypothetical protein
MSGERSLPRRPEQTPSDFETLRGEGLRWIQELSGELWTDYNLHDPGITILEQLCYGLTDLLYRGRFPVQDLLASPDGSIDLVGQALHPPEEAFPSRATTLDDLRRLVLDRVPGVEGIWIDLPGAPGEGAGARSVGVHRIRVHVEGEGHPEDQVCASVRDVLMATRNLGEDVDPDIRILTERHCLLRGRVQIRGERPPEEILAEIHARARRHVAGELDPATGEYRTRIRQAAELQPGGEEETVESRLTGPWMERGSRPGSLVGDESRVHLADLVSLVQDVDGVTAVDELWLDVEGKPEEGSVARMLPAEDRILCLDVPGDGVDRPGIALSRMGRPVALAEAVLRVRYRELRDAHRLARRERTGPLLGLRRPTGANRDDDRYHSIQAHFPAVYGINEQGFPASASEEDRGRVHQLKGYLLPMEQLLANQMTHIRHLRDLFSTADASTPTYRHQVLGDGEIPGVDALYLAPPGKVLEAIYRGMDPGGRLRNRMVDHMLALYGESCNQRSLRQFEHYGPERIDEVVLRNKLAYLRSVVRVGRDRGGSFDHGRPYWDPDRSGGDDPGTNVSGFHLRVGLLLGLRSPGGRSLVRALPPGAESETGGGGAGEDVGPRIRMEGSWKSLPLLPLGEPGDGSTDASPMELPPGTSLLPLLVRGVDLDAYALTRAVGRWVLAIRGDEEGRGWGISHHATEEEAVVAANRLRNHLIDVNLECEGFHVLEHILLRPEGGARTHMGPPLLDGELLWSQFHPLRVSVFFAGWTARARDLRFRLLAEETVRINCPAHIHPECHWLDVPSMREFEGLFGSWLEAKADPAATSSVRDARSARLIQFVLQRQAGQGAP